MDKALKEAYKEYGSELNRRNVMAAISEELMKTAEMDKESLSQEGFEELENFKFIPFIKGAIVWTMVNNMLAILNSRVVESFNHPSNRAVACELMASLLSTTVEEMDDAMLQVQKLTSTGVEEIIEFLKNPDESAERT